MKPSNVYEIKDNKIVRKNPLCPRCGPGTFMANHGDRFTCGKCGYTKWESNK